MPKVSGAEILSLCYTIVGERKAASMLLPLVTDRVNVWATESSETSEEALVEGIELQTLVEEDSQLEVEQDIYEEELQRQL